MQTVMFSLENSLPYFWLRLLDAASLRVKTAAGEDQFDALIKECKEEVK